MDIQYGNPSNLFLLVLAASGLILVGYAAVAKHRGARQFASANMTDKLFASRNSRKHWTSSILIVSSLCLLAVALLDIRWGKTEREVPQKGIEVMFLLDVSRSMLAEDVSPSRLDRAKQQIKDMIDEMTGDRVGLIVFAGETRQSVPLTSHYEDFKQTLDAVGPHSVRRGGSLLGDAIRAATQAFINKTNDHKAIVVFTDGEDQESKPVEAAQEAFEENGIRIFTVGLGDMDQGARIPDSERGGQGYVEYQGQQVWSRMNGEILSQIATDTDGAYIPAGTKRVNMADVYHSYVANVEQTEFETATISAYTPRYQWFALPACLLLILEVLYSTAQQKPRRVTSTVIPGAKKKGAMTAQTTVSKNAVVALLILGTMSMSSNSLTAGETDISVTRASAEKINAANQLVRDGKFEEAFSQYQRVDPSPRDQAELNYNAAVALYRQGEVDQAAEKFKKVAGTSDTTLAARARYNLGNCHYATGLQLAEKDKPAAIEQLKTAIEHYRGSLRSNANNPDAQANIELAAQLIKDLEAQQKQDDQQQQDNQDQNDKEEQNNENDQKQSVEDQQQKSDQQDQQKMDQKDKQSEESSEKSEEQKSDSEQKSEAEQKQNSQGEPEEDQNENSQKQPPQPGDEQKPSDQSDSDNQQMQPQSQQPRENKNPSPAPGDEPTEEQAEMKDTPTGELTSDQEQTTDEKPNSGYGVPDPNAKPGLMNKEEALKLLQSVRDRDMLRRLRQQQIESSRQVPVDRNW